MNLNKKSIVVAGAAGRIGQQLVKSLLDSGANVTAVDQSERVLLDLKERHPEDDRLVYAVADITKKENILLVIDVATKKFGIIDGAVNTTYPRNSNYGRAFLDVSYNDFCENLSLHLGGYFLFMQQCANYSIKNKINFSLVNISSIYGVMAPRFDIYNGTGMTMPVEYAAIKSAIQHLTTYAAAFSKGTSFRVNCVSPGGILAGQDESFLNKYNSHCRNKGMLDAADVSSTVLFILSDKSSYITGQNIVVDDGFSL